MPLIDLVFNFSSAFKLSGIPFDHSEFALPEEEVFDGLELLREEAKAFYKKSISDDQPREDYREMLQLALVFVGGTDSQLPVCIFHAPGALHNSRWMAKGCKSYLFIEDDTRTLPKSIQNDSRGSERPHVRFSLYRSYLCEVLA